jgi:hypothetical protein
LPDCDSSKLNRKNSFERQVYIAMAHKGVFGFLIDELNLCWSFGFPQVAAAPEQSPCLVS